MVPWHQVVFAATLTKREGVPSTCDHDLAKLGTDFDSRGRRGACAPRKPGRDGHGCPGIRRHCRPFFLPTHASFHKDFGISMMLFASALNRCIAPLPQAVRLVSARVLNGVGRLQTRSQPGAKPCSESLECVRSYRTTVCCAASTAAPDMPAETEQSPPAEDTRIPVTVRGGFPARRSWLGDHSACMTWGMHAN